MKKIKQIILKLQSVTLKFNLPPKKKLIVFDDERFEDLKNIVKGHDYFLLQTRFENVDVLYINPIIIFKSLINYRENLWTSYLISLIKIISPKIILTHIDISLKFFEIANKLSNRIDFFAIQSGARYEFSEKSKDDKKISQQVYIPNFFCFGQHEVEDYRKKNINVNNFFPVGSMRFANFITEKKFNSISKIENKYDICLISDGVTLGTSKKYGVTGFEDEMAQFIKYVIKYSLEEKKKIIISFKRLSSSIKNLEAELEFYKKYLNSFEYDFIINNSTLNFKNSTYLSYELMLQSNITISTFSTMLREGLSYSKKILSVNLMNNDIFEFPIEGICKLEKCSYYEFKKRVDEIFSLSNKEYFSRIEKLPTYFMEFNSSVSAIDKIRKKISDYVDTNNVI